MLESITPYLALALGIISLLIAAFFKTDTARLKQYGQKVEGIIFKIESNPSTNSYSNKVTVRFVTDKLVWITSEITQNFFLTYPGQYKPGDKVSIFYDKDDPNNFYVDTKQWDAGARILLTILGLAFFTIGVYQVFIRE